MQRYIGLDVHATSTTIATVGPSGKRLGSEVIATSAAALIDRLKAVPGERYVCMEEGMQSSWLYELLSPHAAEVVVVMRSERPQGPKQNKNDEHDAYLLAEMLRTGQAHPRVFKEQGSFKRLRELARVYTMVMRDVVRVQNRIKALYRSRGVGTSGKSIYGADHRAAWIEKLPDVARTAASTPLRSGGAHLRRLRAWLLPTQDASGRRAGRSERRGDRGATHERRSATQPALPRHFARRSIRCR